MKQSVLIIDGYNVLWRSRAFGKSLDVSLEKARTDLIGLVRKYRSRTSAFSTVVIVFDGGANPGGSKAFSDGTVRVRFSGPGESADDLIRAIVRRHAGGSTVAVVSDDNYVGNNARAHGARLISVAGLMALIDRGRTAPSAAEDEKDIDAATAADITASLKKIWRVG